MGANLRYVQYRYIKFQKRILRAFCRKLYRDKDRAIRKSIFVAGTGRSGTTWLADIIGSQIHCRLMFEPFHSRQVQAFHQFHYFQYMRPNELNDDLLNYCRKILSGDIRNGWIDRQVEHLSPKCRVIKDIRANLFLKWINNMFPEIPFLFIIRHPCAVVLSRMQLGWATDTDIDPFLSQAKLFKDFLSDKVDIIKEAETEEEKHAIIWCISNLIPIKQFNSEGLNVIFYENLCIQPENEVPKIFKAIEHDYTGAVFERLKKPSTTVVKNSAVISGGDKIARWKRELSPKQIQAILSMVDNFELDYIYGESAMPLVTYL